MLWETDVALFPLKAALLALAVVAALKVPQPVV
jgi:hypothetical protein